MKLEETFLTPEVPSRQETTVSDGSTQNTIQRPRASERAIRRIIAEIQAGLRHGFFDYRLTSELVGNGRRRLTLRAGLNFQFLIPADECETGAGLE